MIKLFHKHNWIKQEKTYAPSCFEQGEFKSLTGMEACWESLVFLKGSTTILWECSICKKVRKITLLGKAVKETND